MCGGVCRGFVCNHFWTLSADVSLLLAIVATLLFPPEFALFFGLFSVVSFSCVALVFLAIASPPTLVGVGLVSPPSFAVTFTLSVAFAVAFFSVATLTFAFGSPPSVR